MHYHGDVRTAALDGLRPTTSAGALVMAGSSFTVVGRENVAKLRIIAASGSPVVSFHLLSQDRVE